jgi:iron complex outermembrane receptor protein
MPNLVKSTSCAMASALVSFSMPGAAQIPNEAAPTDTRLLEEVVVTGSLLKRDAGDVAQPIVTLQAEDLIKSGATNPEQILQKIAMNQAVSVSNATIGIGTAAGSYANLRSLGSQRTLVLLNGKRLVNNPYQTVGVDLNTVPTALVREVQVLADGGSATYGTDAIAGVVNFITAKEITGLTASVTGITPEAKGGGQNYLASLSGGIGSLAENGWNIYAGASYRKATELRNATRDFSKTGYLPDRGVDGTQNRSNPANYSQPGIVNALANPAAPLCVPPLVIFADGNYGDHACAYDVLSLLDIVIPQEQWSALTKGRLRLGENHSASLEYVRGDSTITQIVSPQFVNSVQMFPDNPYYPGGGITPANPFPQFDPTQPIRFAYRADELGRRRAEIKGYTDRATAELEGELGAWDYQVSALLSTSEVKIDVVHGYVNDAQLRAAFLGPNGLNAFGPQTEAGHSVLENTEVRGEAQRAIGNLKVYGVQFNRRLFQLPGGRVAFAVAADYKEEDARLENNFAITDQLPAIFQDVSDVSGNRSSKGISVEASFPVLDNLELGLSVRYDDYSDFGNTTNPEFQFNYRTTPWLTLRGTYSTAFRAPTLYDMFRPDTIIFTANSHDDPLLCPGGVVNTAAGGIEERDCATFDVGPNAIVGGNPDLDPEESDAYTLGLLLQPFERMTFGVTYFNYHLTGTIGTLSETAIFGDSEKYADRFIRCSQVPAGERDLYDRCAFGDPTGDPLAYVQQRLDNLGDSKTSGFDFSMNWAGPQTALGSFGLRYTGTYVANYEFQHEPGSAFVSRAGRYVEDSAVLRYVHYLTLSLDRGPLTLELTHSYKSAYEDCNEACLSDPQPQFFNRVDAFQTLDLSATYRWNDSLTIFGTIGNILDEPPPFTNGSSGLSNAWDDRYANGLLRTYLLTITYKF